MPTTIKFISSSGSLKLTLFSPLLTVFGISSRGWLSTFNERKIEVVLFGPIFSTSAPCADLSALTPHLRSVVTNLGVKVDAALRFDNHINGVVKSSFFHLRSLFKIKPFLSKRDLESVIHAFITSRLDYCNSLLTGISQVTLSHLQLVQNAAARF